MNGDGGERDRRIRQDTYRHGPHSPAARLEHGVGTGGHDGQPRAALAAALLIPCLVSDADAADLMAKIQVSGGGTYDYFIVGEIPQASDGYDNAYDSIYPGESLNDTYIASFLVHPEWGAVKPEFRADIRSLAAQQVWHAAVSTNLPNGTQLTLSLREDSVVPARYALMVEDVATGQSFDLRGGYTFTVTDNQASRSFVVTALVAATTPTGSILINNGAAYTRSRAVTLNLLATDTGGSGLDAMRFTNSGGTVTAWEPYATTRAGTLTSGFGTKTVWGQFRDKAGNISDADPVKVGAQIYSDTIAYTGP